mgnify:CR=1 FL=1
MKYYSAILEVARVAGFDVFDDEARLRNTLGDLFPHDKDISVDNPLLLQAMNETLSAWDERLSISNPKYAILYLQPSQTTLSIYEGKRLVFTHSVEQGGVAIRKAVEDIIPEGYKRHATMICERYGSVIPGTVTLYQLRFGHTTLQKFCFGKGVIINQIEFQRATRKRMDDIMSEFLPILKGGDFARHLWSVFIAGEGVGVNGIEEYIHDFLIEHGALVAFPQFLLVCVADNQVDNYISNYYKGYETE